MTTSTLTLTDFLLARIAEDEVVARCATDGPWKHEGAPNGFPPMVIGGDMAVADTFDKPHLSDAAHIARHNPERVLAECEAKRRIVERKSYNDDPNAFPWHAAVLAEVYADHPDWREEWRP